METTARSLGELAADGVDGLENATIKVRLRTQRRIQQPFFFVCVFFSSRQTAIDVDAVVRSD